MSTTGYARLRNDFWRSPKGMKLRKRNPAAGFLHLCAISYASDNLTDGHISEDVAYYSLDATDDQIAFLVDNGYWDESADGDGWTIHDYLEHQNSRDSINETRAKDRARKARKKTQPTTPTQESRRNPDGIQTESDVNPSTSFNQNTKHKTQNTSSDEEVEAARVNAPTTPTEEKPDLDENKLIDLWEPDASAQATADEKARAGYPRVDLAALATRFRRKLHARGLAAYKLLPTRQSLSAEFCTWVEKEAEYMAERAKATPTPPTHVTAPHEHTWTCEHVQSLIAPHEAEYDHERDGFAPSAWMQACNHLADLLNHGTEPSEALADILQEVAA